MTGASRRSRSSAAGLDPATGRRGRRWPRHRRYYLHYAARASGRRNTSQGRRHHRIGHRSLLEIHDVFKETHTGHGIWSAWERQIFPTVCRARRWCASTSIRIRKGLVARAPVGAGPGRGEPRITKTKTTGIPFRMEMSGFARLEGSLPVTADIGVAWPVLAAESPMFSSASTWTSFRLHRRHPKAKKCAHGSATTCGC